MTAINYDQKKFKSVSNTENGEVSGETTFEYFQKGDIIWGTYEGGSIKFGTITGYIDPEGQLHFSYQHVSDENEILTGKCQSKPEITEEGLVRLHENWQWTCRDHSAGFSIIEEIRGIEG